MKNKNPFFQTIKANSELSASLLLILLLLADLAFIILHLVCKTGSEIEWDYSFYNITRERGASEFFMYTKYLWIIALFVIIIGYSKCYRYLSWVVVFLYMLANDSVQINERLGYKLSASFDFVPLFNYTKEFALEIVILIIAVIILFIVITLTYRKGSIQFRKVSLDFSLFLVVLIAFEILFLILHTIINKQGFGLGVVEEGGEMVIIS